MSGPSLWGGAAVAAGIVLLAPVQGLAQGYDAQLRIDQLQPASAFSPFTRAEGPHQQFDEGVEFAARLGVDYQLDPLTARVVTGSTGDEVLEPVSVVEHALLLHIGAALSPIYWLNIEFNQPIAVFEAGADPVVPDDLPGDSGGRREGAEGIGDGRFGLLFRPVTTDEFGFTFGARFWAPWGTDDAYLGSEPPFPRFELVLATAGEYESLLWGCTAGIGPLVFAGRSGDRAALSCAAHFNATQLFSFGLEPHVALFTFPAADKSDSHAPGFGDPAVLGMPGPRAAVQFEPLGALRVHVAGLHVGLAAGPGLGGAPGTPSFRGVFTVGYSALGDPVIEGPGPQDSDLDGLPDDYDKCPKEAGTEKNGGCPEKQDADGDEILEDDACPDEPGPRYDDPAANGCPDKDNDGMADPVDPCPVEPGPKSGGCPRYARLVDLDKPGKIRFRLKPPLQFERRSHKLTAKGIDTLREIVATMRANPKLEQVSITVGARRASQRVTDRRAKTILDIFGEDQDFDTSRYEVVIGDDVPARQVKVRIIQ